MNIELKENTLTPEEFIRLRVDAGAMEVPYAGGKALENGLYVHQPIMRGKADRHGGVS